MSQFWHTGTYDTDMSFVSRYGESLIDLLQPQPGEHIIDWGCGTGDLTAIIANRGAVVTGIDASAEMLDTARSKHPTLSFLLADGQAYTAEQPADAVFSNAALHWLLDTEGAAASIAGSLRPGGRFVAEFGGQGNIASITAGLQRAFAAIGRGDALQVPWYFPTIGQYASLLERHGLTVNLALCFDRPTTLEVGENGFRQWMDTFANGILNSLPHDEREEVLALMEQDLKPSLYKEDRWVIDYRRIRVAAVKPSAKD
ncbi:methyltransferase domain-containing protein [Paenibacillaceae bacterium]|nr:methyltransferase domain-containing protein [Paenibacillaceae bacterium]